MDNDRTAGVNQAMRALATFLLVALLAGGCSSTVSADAARATALKQAGSSTAATVVSVELTTYGAKANGGLVADPSTQVWAVLLSGTFPSASCGGYTPTPHPCPSPAASELILIDAHTGAFIQGEIPAP
jgi:uncharacterized protein YceK